MSEELDIGSLLQTNFDDIKPPPPLQAGPYHAVLEAYEFTRGRFPSRVEQGEKEAVCRFRLRLKAPHATIEELVDPDSIIAGKLMSWDIGIEGKEGRARLKKALAGLGLDVDNRLVSVVLAETSMLPVLATVSVKPSNRGPDAAPFVDISSVVPDTE